MRTTLIDHIKSIFASDKNAYWFDHFTDEEKQLRRMDVWELAKVINEARVHNLVGSTEKIIVAEHMLNVRLAKIQARPAWYAIAGGLIGVVGGAFLTSALQKSDEQPKCVCECKHSGTVQQNVATPITQSVPPVVQRSEPKIQPVQNAGDKQPKAQSHAGAKP